MATFCVGAAEEGAGVVAGVAAGGLSWAEVSAGGLSFLALLLLATALVGAFFGVTWHAPA